MPHQNILNVTHEVTDRAVITIPTGEVGMLSADLPRSEVVERLREPVGHPVIVDLSNVTYWGSYGVAALVEAPGAA